MPSPVRDLRNRCWWPRIALESGNGSNGQLLKERPVLLPGTGFCPSLQCHERATLTRSAAIEALEVAFAVRCRAHSLTAVQRKNTPWLPDPPGRVIYGSVSFPFPCKLTRAPRVRLTRGIVRHRLVLNNASEGIRTAAPTHVRAAPLHGPKRGTYVYLEELRRHI